jgi:hypothetical protein
MALSTLLPVAFPYLAIVPPETEFSAVLNPLDGKPGATNI